MRCIEKAAGCRVAAAIVEEAGASGCDLIVMGTHGRRGVEHLVLGSVAEAVLRRATLPVLLLRARGLDPGTDPMKLLGVPKAFQ